MRAMNIHVDKSGRLVLPKAIRERLGLRRGGKVALEEGPEGVTLRPFKESPRFVDENGIMVFVGKVLKDVDWEKLREEDREARFRELWER
jgi:AbrB family looped-hinge helix DNA binding protein